MADEIADAEAAPSIASLATSAGEARSYGAVQTLPRIALEQRIEQLGVVSREREAEWHCRAFPINHPKNYTAVPTPEAKKAMDELIAIYNTACEKGETELQLLAGKARGMNPLMIYADAHPAVMFGSFAVAGAGMLYLVSQIGQIAKYFSK